MKAKILDQKQIGAYTLYLKRTPAPAHLAPASCQYLVILAHAVGTQGAPLATVYTSTQRAKAIASFVAIAETLYHVPQPGAKAAKPSRKKPAPGQFGFVLVQPADCGFDRYVFPDGRDYTMPRYRSPEHVRNVISACISPLIPVFVQSSL